MISRDWSIDVFCFQSLFRMASAEALAKLETKAVAAEKLIELLRQQISQVSGLGIFGNHCSHV